MEQPKDRAIFTERGEGEYDIPDFPSYTIDDQLVVRSYYGGTMSFKTPKSNGGCLYYKLYGYNENGMRDKYTLSAIRLLLCAKAGVSPLQAKQCDFIFSHDVFQKKFAAVWDGSARQRTTTVENHKAVMVTPEEKQRRAVRKHIDDQQVMLRAIEAHDYTELLGLIQSHRQDVYNFVRSKHYSDARANEVAAATCERTLNCIAYQKIPVANLPAYMCKLAQRIIRSREHV